MVAVRSEDFPDVKSDGIDPGEEAVSPYLWSRGFQKLDVVALTHAHQDHLGGLTAMLENFRVGTLWIGREVSSPALAKLEELAREQRIPIEHELRGKSFSWDGVEGDFLWPETFAEEATAPAKNNDSLVLQLHYGNRRLLLPGDAEKQAEHAILAENDADALRADVLKIGHHGSKNSTSAGISGGRAAANGNHFRRRRQSVRASERRVAGTIGKCRCAHFANGSRRGGTCFDGWNAAGNLLFRGMSGRGTGGSFNGGGETKSQARPREEVRSRRRPAIRGFFCTARRKTRPSILRQVSRRVRRGKKSGTARTYSSKEAP